MAGIRPQCRCCGYPHPLHRPVCTDRPPPPAPRKAVVGLPGSVWLAWSMADEAVGRAGLGADSLVGLTMAELAEVVDYTRALVDAQRHGFKLPERPETVKKLLGRAVSTDNNLPPAAA